MATSLVHAYERKKHQLPTAQCHGMKEFQVSFIVILARKYIACLLYSSKIICMNNRCGLKPVGFRIWKMLTPGTVWQIWNVFILARQKWQEFYRKCHRLPLPLHLPWIQNCFERRCEHAGNEWNRCLLWIPGSDCEEGGGIWFTIQYVWQFEILDKEMIFFSFNLIPGGQLWLCCSGVWLWRSPWSLSWLLLLRPLGHYQRLFHSCETLLEIREWTHKPQASTIPLLLQFRDNFQ